jgi:hypothetical protein
MISLVKDSRKGEEKREEHLKIMRLRPENIRRLEEREAKHEE